MRRIARTLRERGYRTAALEGGYRAWVDAGLPTEERAPGTRGGARVARPG